MVDTKYDGTILNEKIIKWEKSLFSPSFFISYQWLVYQQKMKMERINLLPSNVRSFVGAVDSVVSYSWHIAA